jgi:putative ABC transport system permease protein
MTIRPDLSKFETIVQGEPLPQNVSEDLSQIVPVSLEKRYAQRLGLKVGDELSFDIQGIVMKARVANLRSVKWLSLRPNFFITIPHGILDDAPMTFLAVSQKSQLQNENNFLQKLSMEARSIAAVRLEGVLEQARKISALLISALSLLGYFTLFMAFFVVSVLIKERLQSAKTEIHFLQLAGLPLKKIKQVFYFEILLLVGISYLIAYPVALLMGEMIALEAFDGILHVPWSGIFWQAPLLATAALLIYRSIFNHSIPRN